MIVVACIFNTRQLYGQIDYEASFSIDLSQVEIEEALSIISDTTKYYFAYLEGLPERLNISALKQYDKVSLNELMESLTAETGITYLYRSNQVILKNERAKRIGSQKYIVGQIRDMDSGMPVPYSTLEVKGKGIGVVTDQHGFFRWLKNDLHVGDTLIASSLGYQQKQLMDDWSATNDSLLINLEIKSYVVPTVKVEAANFIKKRVGGTAKKPQGEMYLDTHGQQTAVLINNEGRDKGKIEKLIYYLSKKGNTTAPFRVHIYAVTEGDNGPGVDLIDQFVVVKPEDVKGGWYEVDVLEFNIDIPEEGFYVALEGVFPDDQLSYSTLQSQSQSKGRGLKKRKEIFLKALSYGQRIGFRKAKKNNTWHYSLSGTWFQLEKQSFNVMMGAKLLVEPKRKEE